MVLLELYGIGLSGLLPRLLGLLGLVWDLLIDLCSELSCSFVLLIDPVDVNLGHMYLFCSLLIIQHPSRRGMTASITAYLTCIELKGHKDQSDMVAFLSIFSPKNCLAKVCNDTLFPNPN